MKAVKIDVTPTPEPRVLFLDRPNQAVLDMARRHHFTIASFYYEPKKDMTEHEREM